MSVKEKKRAVVVSFDDAFGREVLAELERLGYTGITVNALDRDGVRDAAKRAEDGLDLLAFAAFEADPACPGPEDFDGITRYGAEGVDAFVLAADAFEEALTKGEKRIGLISDVRGSVRLAALEEGDGTDLAYGMRLAGIHMAAKILFNRLRPEGFTFRAYVCGPGRGGFSPAAYLAANLCHNPGEPPEHSAENRFTLRDGWLAEIPW